MPRAIGIGIGVNFGGRALPGFSPSNLNPALWLDASDTSTITASSGSVSQWDDKSGNGYNVTQATAANQPTTGSTTINGRNVISFDGGDSISYTATTVTLNQPNSVFAVVSSDSGVTGTRSVVNGTGATNALVYVTASSERRVGIWASPPGGQVVTSSLTALTDQTQPAVIGGIFDGSSSRIRLNGASSGAVNAGTMAKGGGFRIGANAAETGEFWIGKIAEVLFFDSLLSSNEIADVETYLAAKWGVTL
jgi:hypothetical protein